MLGLRAGMGENMLKSGWVAIGLDCRPSRRFGGTVPFGTLAEMDFCRHRDLPGRQDKEAGQA